MLHDVKSHKDLYFLHSFNQFILLFSFSSIDRSVTLNQFLLFKKYVYIRSSSSSFEHNTPEIPFLTNEHQEKVTAGVYKTLNVLKMY